MDVAGLYYATFEVPTAVLLTIQGFCYVSLGSCLLVLSVDGFKNKFFFGPLTLNNIM